MTVSFNKIKFILKDTIVGIELGKIYQNGNSIHTTIHSYFNLSDKTNSRSRLRCFD